MHSNSARPHVLSGEELLVDGSSRDAAHLLGRVRAVDRRRQGFVAAIGTVVGVCGVAGKARAVALTADAIPTAGTRAQFSERRVS